MAEAAQGTLCVICQSPFERGEKLVRCTGCRSIYHAECWQDNGGCGVYGCPQVPPTEQRDALEIPAAHWGREDKACPSCGAVILAAARRCRQCGATFKSARPEDARAFRSRQDVEKRLPKVQTRVIWLFVCSVVPCLAPFAAVFGAVWYASCRAEIKALPAMYGALVKIALAIAVGQTAFTILMAVVFSAVRGGG